MTKSEIYKARAQVHGAMTYANNSKAAYSPLLRMEWKKYGYIPVSVNDCVKFNHNARYNAEFLGAQPARAGQDY
jgi:hypothetical protein